jgi:hypothetical protein
MRHLLTGCSFSRTVWFEVLSWIRSTSGPPTDEGDFAEWWSLVVRTAPRQLRKGTSSIIMLTAWRIWKHRNAAVFDSARPSVTSLFNDIVAVWPRRGNGRTREPGACASYSPSLVFSFSWVELYGVLCPYSDLYINSSLSINASKRKAFAFSRKKNTGNELEMEVWCDGGWKLYSDEQSMVDSTVYPHYIPYWRA